MNWSRYKVLLITGGVTLLLAGVGLFMWLKAGGTNAELEKDIDGLQSRRDRLTVESPFPSGQSVEALRREQGKVADLRDRLVKRIEEGQITPPRVVRTMFADYVRDLVPRLRQLAESSTRGGEQVLLRDPDFGMTAYLAGDLPEAARIPSLLLELETMAHLSELLFTSGISELINISVVEKENESDGRRRPGGAFPGRLPGVTRPTPRAGLAGSETEEDPAVARRKEIRGQIDRMFTPLVLELRFSVYEDYFWELMNRLMADPNQFVIQRLRITNGNSTLWPQTVQQPSGNGEGRTPSAGNRRESRPRNDIEEMLAMMEGGDAETEEEADTSRVLIAGLEKRRQRTTGGELLNVSMRIALYRLNPDATAAEEN